MSSNQNFGIDSNGNKVSEGVYNRETGRFDEEETLRILGKYFGEGGELSKMIGASEEFYNWVEKITGMDLSKDDSSSSTGSSIKGITEQKADLLASYLNSVRADVSVIRITQFNYFEDMKRLTTSGNASLRNIENNTAAIMRSNDAIQQSNSEILSIFKRVTQGGDKVRV